MGLMIALTRPKMTATPISVSASTSGLDPDTEMPLRTRVATHRPIAVTPVRIRNRIAFVPPCGARGSMRGRDRILILRQTEGRRLGNEQLCPATDLGRDDRGNGYV